MVLMSQAWRAQGEVVEGEGLGRAHCLRVHDSMLLQT